MDDVSSIAGTGGREGKNETALIFWYQCSITRINLIDPISKYYASRPAKVCENCTGQSPIAVLGHSLVERLVRNVIDGFHYKLLTEKYYMKG
jgi:hypothetical protein